MAVKGFAFSEDTDWQNDFEARFPYTETPDQIKCIEEIKADMENSVPMDRILCGDVGFGKTEVALRAAMKCVMDSKQCAILVPTTILAWQHYKTALSRFDGFPINIAMLSGFRSAKEQAEILKKLRKGEIGGGGGDHKGDLAIDDLTPVLGVDESLQVGAAAGNQNSDLFHSRITFSSPLTMVPMR